MTMLFKLHNIHSYGGVLLVLFFCSILATAQDDSVCLKQDEVGCDAETWPGEYWCIRQKISLQRALSCVRPLQNDKPENQICRNMTYKSQVDELWELSDPDYKDYTRVQFSDGEYQLCTSPRTLILETHKIMKPADQISASIAGQLKACPKLDEKNYKNCLCMAYVGSYALGIIADYFGFASYWSALMCYWEDEPNQPSIKKRELSDEDMRTFPVVENEESKLSIQARANIPGFVDITSDGRPIYINPDTEKQMTALAPLPHFYENIWNNRGARRCFVHPQEAEILTCTTWLYPSGVTRTLSGVPTMASYKDFDTDPSFVSTSEWATRSEEPAAAAVPSLSYSYSQQSVSEPPVPTSSPTVDPEPTANPEPTGASLAPSVRVSLVLCTSFSAISVMLGVLTY